MLYGKRRNALSKEVLIVGRCFVNPAVVVASNDVGLLDESKG